MLSPKALEKALVQSADRAQRMADAFGLKVPVAARGAGDKAARALGHCAFLLVCRVLQCSKNQATV